MSFLLHTDFKLFRWYYGRVGKEERAELGEIQQKQCCNAKDGSISVWEAGQQCTRKNETKGKRILKQSNTEKTFICMKIP